MKFLPTYAAIAMLILGVPVQSAYAGCDPDDGYDPQPDGTLLLATCWPNFIDGNPPGQPWYTTNPKVTLYAEMYIAYSGDAECYSNIAGFSHTYSTQPTYTAAIQTCLNHAAELCQDFRNVGYPVGAFKFRIRDVYNTTLSEAVIRCRRQVSPASPL